MEHSGFDPHPSACGLFCYGMSPNVNNPWCGYLVCSCIIMVLWMSGAVGKREGTFPPVKGVECGSQAGVVAQPSEISLLD